MSGRENEGPASVQASRKKECNQAIHSATYKYGLGMGNDGSDGDGNGGAISP